MQSPQLQSFAGLGVNPALAGDMTPEYGNEVFKNLQMASAGAQKARRQGVLDNTGRFGSTGAGGQLGALQQVGQQTADQTLQAAGGAGVQGAQLGQQNRQFNAGLSFQGQQAALDRQLKQNQLQAQMQQEQSQFGQNRADSQENRLWNLFSGGAGMLASFI